MFLFRRKVCFFAYVKSYVQVSAYIKAADMGR